jgi:hypothetical protein
VVDAQIPADADDPRLEIGAAIERAQRLEDLEEDVLREIFRLVVLADELVGDVEHFPPVLADDLLPCLLIAAQTLLDQGVRRRGLSCRGISRHASLSCYLTCFRHSAQ